MMHHPTRPYGVSTDAGTGLPLTRRDLLQRGASAAALAGTAPLASQRPLTLDLAREEKHWQTQQGPVSLSPRF